MSEFIVIKCKKCDAPLVQLQGEILTSCVQCGYKFPLLKNAPKQKVTSLIKNKVATPEVANLLKKLNQIKASKIGNTSPEEADVVRKIRQNKPTKTTTSKTKITMPTKKKSNPIATVIYWIILISIIRGVFSN